MTPHAESSFPDLPGLPGLPHVPHLPHVPGLPHGAAGVVLLATPVGGSLALAAADRTAEQAAALRFLHAALEHLDAASRHAADALAVEWVSRAATAYGARAAEASSRATAASALLGVALASGAAWQAAS